LRIGIGIVLPVILWGQAQLNIPYLIVYFLLVGELIDRIEFYLESEIMTPKRQIIKDTLKILET